MSLVRGIDARRSSRSWCGRSSRCAPSWASSSSPRASRPPPSATRWSTWAAISARATCSPSPAAASRRRDLAALTLRSRPRPSSSISGRGAATAGRRIPSSDERTARGRAPRSSRGFGAATPQPVLTCAQEVSYDAAGRPSSCGPECRRSSYARSPCTMALVGRSRTAAPRRRRSRAVAPSIDEAKERLAPEAPRPDARSVHVQGDVAPAG